MTNTIIRGMTMSRRLGISTFFTNGITLSSADFDKVVGYEEDMIVIPDITKDVLEQYDAMPEIGEEDDEEEALEDAKEQFEYSNSYYEWKDSFTPMMTTLWPCEPFTEDKEVANRLEELGVAVCYVNGTSGDSSFQGFMMTGGGMDLSDHLAMAYLAADCMPPQPLLERAIRNTHNDSWREALIDALSQARDYLVREAESYNETITRYRAAAPSLT